MIEQAYAVETVALADGRCMITLVDGRSASFETSDFRLMRDATEVQLSNWEISGGGLGLHWPDLDEDLFLPILFGDATATA